MIEIARNTLNANQVEIIKAALYFDIFKYPLTQEELFESSAISISKDQFIKELTTLVDHKFLTRNGEFILCNERTDADITSRLKGNSGAQKIMPVAYEYSKKVASFPFVEGVCLSGGLSKKYYDEKGDIDFFIFTRPNRLWLCRTLLILKYKLLPKHKKKFWCTNYFISSDNLDLPDVNSFTATELAFLIPTVNYGLYTKLLDRNIWYKKHLPNKPRAKEENCIEIPSSFLKSFTENILGGRFGDWLDSALLNFTLKHWKKKYPELSSEDFELQFRSQKNVCKRHTKGFQNKVLIQWYEKQKKFEHLFNVSLH